MTDVKQILWLIKNQLAKGKDALRTAFIRKTSTHHTPCGHNKASLGTFLNDLPQQVGHRFLPVADILDNPSRSCGEATIAPE